MEFRATAARPPEGKPAWYGQWRDNAGEWQTAESQYGKIIYTAPEYAVAGTKVAAEARRS